MSTGARAVPVAEGIGDSAFAHAAPGYRNWYMQRYRYASLFAHFKRVLDLGCGPGFGTAALGYGARKAVGADLSIPAMEPVPARDSHVQFLAASPEQMPFAKASFDVVTAFEAVPGAFDWPQVVAAAEQVLAQGGIFLACPSFAGAGDAEALREWGVLLRAMFAHVRLLSRDFSDASEENSEIVLAVCSDNAFELPSPLRLPVVSDPMREELEQLRHERHALSQLRQRLDQRIFFTEAQVDRLRQEGQLARQSAWVRLGCFLHVGPWAPPIDFAAPVRSIRGWLNHSLAPWLKTQNDILASWLNQQAEPFQPYWEVATDFAAYCLSPVLLLMSAALLLIGDLLFHLFGRRMATSDVAPEHTSASIIIPNWNGWELLAAFLPSVLEAAGKAPESEVIVVDNASTDGSVRMVQEQFPSVRVLQLRENLGFAGACNFAVAEARNEVVVFLNNDMRVEPGFLNPLLEKFSEPRVFAVSSQIFFSNPKRRREETGLTEVWWEKGFLGVPHHIDPGIKQAFPCAYPGGGSSAVDKRKFLELGGFDALFHPFYYEDTDLGRLAWKRGWTVLYEPSSVVFHEHRGTVGRNFTDNYIRHIVRKNALLYCWKNIHDWRLLGSHFFGCIIHSFRNSGSNCRCFPQDSLQCSRQIGQILRSRWLAHRLGRVSDREAFRRPLGGYYRDRFIAGRYSPGRRLNILFVSPYPIEPPVHGGAVFMKETITALTALADVHLLSFVDSRSQLGAQERLRSLCKSVKFLVRRGVLLRNQWTLRPNAFREFECRELAWAIHRAIYREKVDLVQFEYTVLAQYFSDFKHIPSVLFEHDISIQSLRRQIRTSPLRLALLLEYVRLRLAEPRLLKRFARVQVCSRENKDYLASLLPGMAKRIDCDVRAGIDVSRYVFTVDGRELETLLFVGSFRHIPNVEGLRWFLAQVFPLIVASRPGVQLLIAGSDAPKATAEWINHPNVRWLGAVPDVRPLLHRYAVFICPILSGSGVRVKLLEAFASGIPVVSTTLGAEGLIGSDQPICELADHAEEFANGVLRLLNGCDYGHLLARRARAMVENRRNAPVMTRRLEEVYRAEVARVRPPFEVMLQLGERDREIPELKAYN